MESVKSKLGVGEAWVGIPTVRSMDMNNRPHIFFIMTDQHRHDCLGAAGHPILRTPNMDAIAQTGTRFTHAHTVSPLCMPARQALISGQYPHNTHLWQNDARLPAGSETYVGALQRGGYRTCHIGKGHLYYHENMSLKKEEPYMRSLGWEDLYETQGTWASASADSVYYDYLKEHGLNEVFDNYLIELDMKPDGVRRFIAEPSPLAEEHVLDSFIGRTAVDYVQNYSDDRPSFVFVGFAGPHEPWDAPGRFATMYKPEDCPDPIPEGEMGSWLSEESRNYDHWAQYFQPEDELGYKWIAANYFGKISLIDEWIGRILEAYKQRGWLENTVIILTSDHGEALGDHNRVSKSMYYESMVRVPLLIAGPGVRKGVSDAFANTLDLYPTVLDLAGCDSALGPDGKSLMSVLTGEATGIHENVLAEVHTTAMLRNREWKLVVGRDGRTLQFFDLANDPLEQANLAGHPDYGEVDLRMRSDMLSRILATRQYAGFKDPDESHHEAGLLARFIAEAKAMQL